MKQVLHVGCGAATIAAMPQGFQSGEWREVRFDITPEVMPDIVGNMTNMVGVAGGSMDAVYSSHNVEHVFAHQVASVLREFHRVLKPGGFAVITCPDIESVAPHVAQGRLTEPLYTSPSGPITALDILYGHGASIAGGQEYMAHRTAFTAKSLTDALTAAGFYAVGMRRRPQRFDLWAIGARDQIEESRLRELMSLYIQP